MRSLQFGLIILAAIALAGCAAWNPPREGELRIRNRSGSDIWISIDGSEAKQLDSLSYWSRYFTQISEVDIAFRGNLVFPNSISQMVKPTQVTTLDIVADGGAIKLLNNSGLAITEVYLSEAGNPNWGVNDLGGTVEPGGDALWTVRPGNWDIRYIDSAMASHFIYDQSVSLNRTLLLETGVFTRTESKPKQFLRAEVPDPSTQEHY